jgi:hypothetical protein
MLSTLDMTIKANWRVAANRRSSKHCPRRRALGNWCFVTDTHPSMLWDWSSLQHSWLLLLLLLLLRLH